MSGERQVHWGQGAFLSPQHLQAQEIVQLGAVRAAVAGEVFTHAGHEISHPAVSGGFLHVLQLRAEELLCPGTAAGRQQHQGKQRPPPAAEHDR